MATALTPSSSSNNKQWWPRLSSSKESSPYTPVSNLYTDISSYIGGRPHSAAGAVRRPLMTSVTNPSPTSPNAFTVSSKSTSRFKLAAVIGFGSRSKKQQPVDIQDPPQHVRSLPTQKSNTTKEFSVSPHPLASPNPSLSRGVVSSGSGTSRASTDCPLTPADDPSSPGPLVSYQQSLMTLTDADPFSTTVSFNDRRSSTHSDKSLSRRLMQKIDGKSVKTNARLPVSDGSKKESRDRSATLPTRVRTSDDALEAYQSLRAVEPPWATSDQLEISMTSSRASSKDHSKLTRGASSGTTLRHSKSSKAALPWPQTQVAREKVSSQSHQRKNSSSSISKEPLTGIRRSHTARPSTSSSASPTSSMLISHLSTNSSLPRSGSGQLADVRHVATSLSRTSSAKTLPTLPKHIARTSPRPPPTAGLPPTPLLSQDSGSSSPKRLHPPSSPFAEHHSLRSRSGTTASASSVSFASSLSSLSFNSRPSPQEPPTGGTYDYPNLLDESLPVPGEVDDAVPRRGSDFGSSTELHKDSKARGSALSPTNSPTRNDHTPKPSKAALPGSRPLPSPPGSSPSAGVGIRRERALSALSSSSDAVKTLRKQRSFHNTSHHAPTSLVPTLRHYSSFDPSVAPGSEDHMHSPPLPTLGSPSLPPSHDAPQQPPTNTSITKRVSAGKESATSPSPRRKLFGSSKHDRDKERERKHELDHVDTAIPMNASSAGLSSTSSSVLAHSSSSWFDDRGSEPASATSVSPSTNHDVAQHIVPPAELLRLGAAWERESESRNGLRRTKSSWGSRESDTSHVSIGSSSSKTPSHPSAPNGSSSPTPGSSGSKLPRSASLLSKASSAPSFSRTRGVPPDLSFAPSNLALPSESYTSLSPPPPRRQHRSISRMSPQVVSGFPPQSQRTPSIASAKSSGSMPPKGALIERKPSFLDMTTTRQSVTIDVPDLAANEREEYERDSFLELSRGVDSIDTIRESISSVDSFMQ